MEDILKKALEDIIEGADRSDCCRYCGAAEVPYKDGEALSWDSVDERGIEPDEYHIPRHEDGCPVAIAQKALARCYLEEGG
jgi:hypothetical protein